MDSKTRVPAGYLPIGKRFISYSFFLFISLGILALAMLYATSLHPIAVRLWYSWRQMPVFAIDSPHLADYSGNARLVLPDGAPLYQGGVEGANANGWGELYENGALVYEGEFLQGFYHGTGTLYYASGRPMYHGGFMSNSFDGSGVLYDKSGEIIYEGLFSEGVYSGLGTLNYRLNGQQYTYVGSFTSGVRNGSGRIYKGTALIYDGEFKDDLRHGSGAEYQNGALLYTGSFASDEYSGAGKLYDAQGQPEYDGDFLFGLPDGAGKLYSGGVLLYDGEFSRGKYNGDGTLYDILTGFPVFSGKFLDGHPMEAGVRFGSDGIPATEAPSPPTPRPDPASLLGNSYSDVLHALSLSGIAVKEQLMDGLQLAIDEDSGVIYRFSDPGHLVSVYYYGLMAADGIIVGADISDFAATAGRKAEITTAEMLALGYSNALWGREAAASELDCAVFAGKTRTITAYYLPVKPDEEQEDEPAAPAGKIYFIKIDYSATAEGRK